MTTDTTPLKYEKRQKAENKRYYHYGMRLRGCSIGAQPDGFIKRYDDENGVFYDILVYDRMLTAKETLHYGLDLIKIGNKSCNIK